MASEAKGARFRWEDAFLAGPFTKTQRVVGLVLATHFSEILQAYPGIKRLAKLSGCNEKTVRRAIREIEDAGFLVVTRSGPGAGSGHTNRYQGVIPTELYGSAQTHIDASSNGSLDSRKRVSPASKKGLSSPPNNKEQEEQAAAAADREGAAAAIRKIRGARSWSEWVEAGGPPADRRLSSAAASVETDPVLPPTDCPFYFAETTALDEPRLRRFTS